MALDVGSRLGHYDVTALIGDGGMGQVYQATDTKLHWKVAQCRPPVRQSLTLRMIIAIAIVGLSSSTAVVRAQQPAVCARHGTDRVIRR